MSGYYTYLVSSLPMLHFGAPPPFSFGSFLQICRGLISGNEVDILKEASVTEKCLDRSAQPALRRWRAFETALRNELVKIRAARRHADPAKYLRGDGGTEPSIAHIAINAYRNPSPLESERMLDRERWNALDEIAAGHYFDIDFLIIYAHKLLILERWGKIRTADGSGMIENAIKQS